jgi:hypothetical protein
MGNIYNLFNRFFGKIVLTKKRFLQKDLTLIIFISHNLKIVKVKKNSNLIKNNFNENTILSLDELKIWSEENSFTVTCVTNNSSIKREFYTTFNDEYFNNTSSKKKIYKFFSQNKKDNFSYFQKKEDLKLLYNFFDIYLILV